MSGPDMRLLEDPRTWSAAFGGLAATQPACARAAFLVTPEGFWVSAESAADNAYMQTGTVVDADRALAQHRALQQALSAAGIPTVSFSGRAETPDAVFPNNVFATARVADRPRLLIGSMRHPVRRREAERVDIIDWFRCVMGYEVVDLRASPGISELTGTLVIDRARGLGLAGLSSRCDDAGVRSMQEAFGLNAVLQFALAEGEYHTNVVLSVLASRALVLASGGLADPDAAAALAALYAPSVIELDASEHAAFAGNCIALGQAEVWMSERAADSLTPTSHAGLRRAGFAVRAVALDAIEAAGGSLRCCVAEIY